MDLNRKTFKPNLFLKADAPGSLSVEFATLNTIDLDGDVTIPGAFGQQSVRIQSHGHATGDWSIGKGTIREAGDKAIMDGTINLDMMAGKEGYASLKFDLENGDPLQEWSYVFRIVEADFGEFESRQVRFLKRLKVLSVDPVFLGAGIGTRTTAVKNLNDLTFLEHCGEVEGLLAEFNARIRARKDYREKEGRTMSAANMDRMMAIMDSMRGAMSEMEAMLDDMRPPKESSSQELIQQKLRYERVRAGLMLGVGG